MRLTIPIRRDCTVDLWSHGAFCLSVCHAVITTGNCVVTVLVGVVGLRNVDTYHRDDNHATRNSGVRRCYVDSMRLRLHR